MTDRDEIIRMARELGMPPIEITSDKPVLYPSPDAIERFYRAAFAAGAAAEREACAKVCDAADKSTHPTDLADAIRARGKA